MISNELNAKISLPYDDGGGVLELSATLYRPVAECSGDWLFFCLPGGGNTGKLFDLGEADGMSYSFARHLTGHGHAVIAMDTPGTAGNTLPPTHPFLTPRKSASYLAQAFIQFKRQAGMTAARTIACGHSMGGMMSILTNSHLKKHFPDMAHHALLMIGSSAGGLEWGMTDAERPYVGQPDALEENLQDIVMERYGSEFPVYPSCPRFGSKSFGGETEASNQLLHTVVCELFAAGGTTSMVPGGFMAEVGEVTEPMMMVFGEHDLGVPPEEAVKDFDQAASMRVHIMEGASHNSFAFKSIIPMCAEVDDWVKSL